MILCQIHDTQNYINSLTKINVLNPVEILMPSSQVDNPLNNRLFMAVKQYFADRHSTSLTAIPRKAFSSDSGLYYVNKLSMAEFNSVMLLIKHK